MAYFKNYNRKSAPVEYNYSSGLIDTDSYVRINTNLDCSGYNRVGLFFESTTGANNKVTLYVLPKPASNINIDLSEEPRFLYGSSMDDVGFDTIQDKHNLFGMENIDTFNVHDVKTSGIPSLQGMDYVDIIAKTESTTSVTNIKYWVVFYND